ncbi:MAG: hypothetical protein JWM10_788 [Myxococcaceae bacterium]|nr:hypothetical protein [Myxococcaceae bacterium]
MNGYKGPVVLLTLVEAAAVLPAAPVSEAEKSAHDKITIALNSAPSWREALR